MNDALLNELCKEKVDFEKCNNLINTGADINKMLPEGGNLLSEAILEAKGNNILTIIKWFLSNGFDVGTNDGTYGAACLQALCYSKEVTYIVDAAKELVRAGAVDVIHHKDRKSALELAEIRLSTMDSDYCKVYYFEAFLRIMEALKKGITESGIDVFSMAVGHRVDHVYALVGGDENVFLNSNGYANTFTSTLFFEYDKGFLVIDRYACAWVVEHLPVGSIEDVSDYFKGIIGRKVKNIDFVRIERVKGYSHPQIEITMDSGHLIKISTNYGEFKREEDYRAHFSIVF